MRWFKFNVIGIIVFIVGDLLGFIVDIICGTGGSEKIFEWFLLIALIVSLILFLKGTYRGLISLNSSLSKGLLFIFNIVLSIVQLLICYIFSTIVVLYVVAPIMLKLGYYVTMP